MIANETHQRRKWQPTPVFLPGEFHGQRSLAGYSPCGHKELDMTEQLIYTLVIPIAFLSEVHLNGLSWNYALSYSKFSSIFVCFQLSTLFLGLLVCLWAVILSISNLLSGKAMGLQRVGHDLATEQQKGHSSEFTLFFHCFLSFPHHPTKSLLFIFGR